MTYHRKQPAVGNRRHSGGLVRIAVAFDPETFQQISDRAQAARTTFAEEVRVLVEMGLETMGADAALYQEQ